MNMKKWITAAAVMAVSASLAIAMPREATGRGGHRGRGMKGEKLAQKLNLTDTQKAQIRDLHKTFRQDNRAFLESARQTRQEYRAARQANDTAKLNSLKPTVESQRAQMRQLRDAQDAKILTTLTPDQQSQFKALKAERAQRWQERSGR